MKRDIEERTFKYALRAIKVYQALQQSKDGAGWVIGKQFLRLVISVGANVAEAQDAERRADFATRPRALSGDCSV